MTPALTIALPSPLISPATRGLMALLNRGAQDGAPQALFVGGCVRNAVRGEDCGDIDIATLLTPNLVMDILSAAAIRVIPTGIEHGTVTALHDGQPYEITTLRRDVATDGRRAVVAFSTDWAEDAARRDFTLNTLLADADGRIYDPLGTGLADARAGRVVFVGDPARRVAEDYLRILRFFRFHARYGAGAPDAAGLAACAVAAARLATLSRERVTDEFLKILAVDNIVDTLRLMFTHNILGQFPHKDYQEKVLNDLVSLQKGTGWRAVLPRLAVLAGRDDAHLGTLSQYIVLSNEKWDELGVYTGAARAVPGVRETKYWIYRHGPARARQLALLNLAAAGRVALTPDIVELLSVWQAPRLPVNGADAMAAGIAQGPVIGKVLHEIETWWIENDFAPDRESCLRRLQMVAGRG